MENFEIIDILRSKNIKASIQRIAIYSYLCNKRNHPTVEMIYNELISIYPMLSKTTIYNTLNLFLEHKLVRVLIIEENELRYDANVSEHAHLKCRKCSQIYDHFYDKKFNIPIDNFQIEDIEINLRGICHKCL